jgi:hydroxymethylbilane synthase
VKRLRIGTRKSRLALIQSELVAKKLWRLGVPTEMVEIVTEGDLRAKDSPIADGVFVADLEQALRSGEIDLAVHSAKDVPLDLDPALPLVAFPDRADPRDVLVTRHGERSLSELPYGARVGTDSPRRTAFALAMRPDLSIFPLMGNVDVRVARLDAGEADALILAAAGLVRLGLEDRISVYLEPGVMPPAPAQGALAIQARREDRATLQVMRQIDRLAIRQAVVAERAILKAFGGGYSVPVGALATPAGNGRLNVVAGASTPDGSKRCVLTAVLVIDDVAVGAYVLARELHRRVPMPTRAVLDTRPEGDPRLASRFLQQGFRTVRIPTIAISLSRDSAELERARRELASYDWVVLTSKRGVQAICEGLAKPIPAGLRWAAVGATTERALNEWGIRVHVRPQIAVGEAIPAAMQELSSLRGARVLLPRSSAADDALPEALRRLGAEVRDLVAYESVRAPLASAEPLHQALLDPELEAVVFASGTAVRGFCELAGGAVKKARRLKILTIGPKTSAAARSAGLQVTAEAATPDGGGLSAALAYAHRKEVKQWLDSQITSFD